MRKLTTNQETMLAQWQQHTSAGSGVRNPDPAFGSMTENLDGKPTCRVVRAGAEFVGKQGHLLAPGVSAQSTGARRIHLQIATIPPGIRANAHKHADHETAIYVLRGESGMWYGEKLEQHLIACAGDFLYIPANVPHLPYNLSESESCVAVIARTDPNEQESVILLPELDVLRETLRGAKIRDTRRQDDK